MNGVLLPAGNIVDQSAQIGRTREAIVGMQHELIANLAVGVDFIYRKYDRGTTTYTIGYQPGGPNGSLSAIYVPADLHRSGHGPERDLLPGLRRLHASVGRRQHHGDEPELAGLQGRRPDRHQAVQQPVADGGRA